MSFEQNGAEAFGKSAERRRFAAQFQGTGELPHFRHAEQV
jgi:hypothetical protein